MGRVGDAYALRFREAIRTTASASEARLEATEEAERVLAEEPPAPEVTTTDEIQPSTWLPT